VLKGFKDFIMRGNVLDLAVAVVMGTAFTAIVTSITNSLIKPLINSIGGAKVTGLGYQIIGGRNNTYIDLAAVINAVINFLIIAAVVYFALVLPVKKIQQRRKRGEEPGPSEPTDVQLLIQIRDLLAEQQRAGDR
jgi:large conductance mechanosensitive channel